MIRTTTFMAQLITLMSLLFSVSLSAASTSDRPNFVFILADDLGYGDVSCLNNESKVQTPNLDALAQGGMTFTDAHSNSSVCTPTRYGVLTGRYAWRSQLKKGVLNGYSPALIEEGRMTVASLLHGAGYKTACIGKWHLGMNFQRNDDVWDYSANILRGPNTLGFDYFYGISASLDMPPYCYIENDTIPDVPASLIDASPYPKYWRNGPATPGFIFEDSLPHLTQKAVAFLEQQSDKQPFFLYLPLPSPHKPVVPNKQFSGKTFGPYGDYVAETDWSVGEIINALKKKGLFDNTVLLFTSDNASFASVEQYDVIQHGHQPNRPFRGQKTDAYEGGHHVAYFASWPGKITAGSRCDQTICTTDFLATAAAIIGKPLPQDAGEDSYNLLPLFDQSQGDKPLREATVHHSASGLFAIRKGKWKLIDGQGSGGRTKVPKTDPNVQLYDMEKDISETTNLYEQHPEIVAELKALLEKYKQADRSVVR